DHRPLWRLPNPVLGRRRGGGGLCRSSVYDLAGSCDLGLRPDRSWRVQYRAGSVPVGRIAKNHAVGTGCGLHHHHRLCRRAPGARCRGACGAFNRPSSRLLGFGRASTSGADFRTLRHEDGL
ncbi:hypothetical protein LTR94_031570, partial [Friedmanniomyces endolithicus]